jgi:thioredoxin 1
MAGQFTAELNDANFDEKVSSGLSLVDFWAPWCGPCRMQGPIVDQLAEDMKDKGVLIAKVNVDESPNVAARFGIRSIPSIFILKDGEAVEQFVGLQTADKLEAAIQKHTA